MSDVQFFLTMAGALGLMIVLLAFNIFVRGPKVMRANAEIVAGQKRIIEQGERTEALTLRGLEVQERQAAALERIAAAEEARNG